MTECIDLWNTHTSERQIANQELSQMGRIHYDRGETRIMKEVKEKDSPKANGHLKPLHNYKILSTHL